MKFSRARKGAVTVRLEAGEARLLSRCAADLLELLGPEPVEQDDLFASLGLSGGQVDRPSDPALLRLFPDAYASADEAGREATADFRRFTESDLRAGKRRDARTLVETLQGADGAVQLDGRQTAAWLGCLNDLRLVLGARLEVTEQMDLGDVSEDAPEHHALMVYTWLGGVQELLLQRLL